jgi:deoxyribonuclease-4
MRVGVHCSMRRGFSAALEEAAALGCETLQLFTQSPRGWRTRVYSEDEFQRFRSRRLELKIDPIVAHSPYLPNLCTSDDLLFERSLSTLISDLDRCEKLGAEYLVIHPGAYSPNSNFEEGVDRLHLALNKALSHVPGRTKILIENMAGGGRRIGGPFKEMAAILDGVKSKNRIGVCFDTCHATGAGYDLSNKSSVDRVLSEFHNTVGLEKIFVFHVNDSKGHVGSHCDIHQHLGQGHVGLDGFRAIFSKPAFRNCALILETPYDTHHAHPRNLALLRSLIAPIH